jgi:acetoin utilization deacetylase AcuC-like enzyme
LALPFKLLYSDRYDLNLGAHVFPAAKYRLTRERLLSEGWVEPVDFVEPQAATDLDMLRVHTVSWVEKLRQGKLAGHDILKLEVPYSKEFVDAVWLSTGGSIEAGRLALRDGLGFNVGGGFHHAFPGHGEGFCAINDIAVAVRALQEDDSGGQRIERAMIVDLDVHQGNGTAVIFHDDPTVFTFSMHQLHNYPPDKPPSDLDVHLPDRCSDEQYLRILAEKYPHALVEFVPDIVFYVAGADPYFDDQLGGLGLTLQGLKDRDKYVIRIARQQGIPVAVLLAGGYAHKLEDTVTIHANTVLAAKEVMEG